MLVVIRFSPLIRSRVSDFVIPSEGASHGFVSLLHILPTSMSTARATQLLQVGDVFGAETEARRALQSNPDDPETLHLLGLIMMSQGKRIDAIALFDRAIAGDGSVGRYYVNRGEVHRILGNLDQAVSDLERAVHLDPTNSVARYNLGLTYRTLGRLDDAIESYRRAVRIRHRYPKAHYNLGNALRAKLMPDEAERAYRDALAIDPNYAEAWNNLGEMLSEQMRIDEATQCFERAIALLPNHAGAHFNRGFLQLLRGEYGSAWTEYEWRWKTGTFPAPPPGFPPVWDGSDLNGKTILLLGEQGAGDTIQFARYATMLAQRGGKVIARSNPNVASLIATIQGVAQVVTDEEPIPPCDCYIAMLSAPRVLGTTIDNLPRDVPYITADPAEVETWREKLAPHRRALNVGLSWAGNPIQANDRNRSARLDELSPLVGVADTAIFSLQKGPTISQIAESGLDMIDLSNDIHDFSDTAAIVANLDVVVSVCTSVAHIAGAIAKPTLVMLCYNADWRWLLDREDSPWYPTMKLFRQKQQGDWQDVAQRVRLELERMRDAKASPIITSNVELHAEHSEPDQSVRVPAGDRSEVSRADRVSPAETEPGRGDETG